VKIWICRAKTSEGDGGYSFLELLVVIALVGLVLSVTSGVYAKLIPGYQVRQFSYDFINYCRVQRDLAHSEQITTEIDFGVDGKLVALSGSGLEVPAGVLIELVPAEQWSVEGDYRLRFYPDGGSSGGTVKMSWSNSEVVLKIDWVSGAVKVAQ